MRKFAEQDPAAGPAPTGDGKDIAAPAKGVTLYRTCLAIFTVVMSLVLLIVVVVSSGSYSLRGQRKHKALVIVVDQLSDDILDFAWKSNKAPFTQQLIVLGSVYGSVAVPSGVSDAASANAAMLTGLAPEVTGVWRASDLGRLTNTTSYLRLAKNTEMRPGLVAPTAMFSGTSSVAARCQPVGVLDAECVGFACPGADSESYCNGPWRSATCDDPSGTTRNEEYVFTKVEAATGNGAELVYAQLSNFASGSQDKSVNSLAALSEVFMTDALIGRIAALLTQRSAAKPEDWLLVVVGDGMNAAQKAPLVIAKFSEGATKPLPAGILPAVTPAAATTPAPSGSVATPQVGGSLLDIYPTIVSWLGLEPRVPSQYKGVIQAICSNAPNGPVSTLATGCRA